MTGLEKIIDRIQHDADNTINGIRSKSEAQCKALLSEAESEVQVLLLKGKADADKKYNDIIARAQSAASLEERKIMLSAKQEIISTMISNTLNSLLNLPDDKYFTLIYKFIERYSLNSDGVISFNKADLKRLPADFADKANAVSKGVLTLGADPVEIDGGFILSSGGVDVNCSISSLINDNSEKISDSVAQLLFA